MTEQPDKVTYISNAGVMVELDGRKILIDSISGSTIPYYRSPSAATRKRMILGLPPFDNIACLLITHHHSDHFDPEGAACFVRHRRDAPVIATREVVSQIYSRLGSMEKRSLIPVETPAGVFQEISVNGMKIQAVAMRHDGEQYRDVPNLAYLIEAAGKTILHVGDAKPVPENYRHLNLVARNINLLLAPFPYIGLPQGRRVIAEYVKPRKIAVIHLPVRELDRGGWIDATMKQYLKVKDDFAETVFFEAAGDYTMVS
jgi:L-ascorbate metabolism protein UlaG (beta-lactamase superfamily)